MTAIVLLPTHAAPALPATGSTVPWWVVLIVIVVVVAGVALIVAGRRRTRGGRHDPSN